MVEFSAGTQISKDIFGKLNKNWQPVTTVDTHKIVHIEFHANSNEICGKIHVVVMHVQHD